MQNVTLFNFVTVNINFVSSQQQYDRISGLKSSKRNEFSLILTSRSYKHFFNDNPISRYLILVNISFII